MTVALAVRPLDVRPDATVDAAVAASRSLRVGHFADVAVASGERFAESFLDCFRARALSRPGRDGVLTVIQASMAGAAEGFIPNSVMLAGVLALITSIVNLAPPVMGAFR
jgi:hypothetical protein